MISCESAFELCLSLSTCRTDYGSHYVALYIYIYTTHHPLPNPSSPTHSPRKGDQRRDTYRRYLTRVCVPQLIIKRYLCAGWVSRGANYMNCICFVCIYGTWAYALSWRNLRAWVCLFCETDECLYTNIHTWEQDRSAIAATQSHLIILCGLLVDGWRSRGPRREWVPSPSCDLDFACAHQKYARGTRIVIQNVYCIKIKFVFVLSIGENINHTTEHLVRCHENNATSLWTPDIWRSEDGTNMLLYCKWVQRSWIIISWETFYLLGILIIKMLNILIFFF